VLIETPEHLIRSADCLRSSSELAEYKALSFGLVPRSARCVLDLGSATGEDALALAECLGPQCQVIGLELDAGLVEEARRRSRNVALDVHFVVGDCRALPFAAATFDVVRADSVFGLLPEPLEAFAECARVLRPDGLLILHDEGTGVDAQPKGPGLTLVTRLDVPYDGRVVPTWFFAKHENHDDVPA
jgi:ubiquinone/menaquinone biosynthesis C-methylase UbiE